MTQPTDAELISWLLGDACRWPEGSEPARYYRQAASRIEALGREVGKANMIAEAMRRARDRYLPCPDCRDKVEAGDCQRCARQRAERQRDNAIARAEAAEAALAALRKPLPEPELAEIERRLGHGLGCEYSGSGQARDDVHALLTALRAERAGRERITQELLGMSDLDIPFPDPRLPGGNTDFMRGVVQGHAEAREYLCKRARAALPERKGEKADG